MTCKGHDTNCNCDQSCHIARQFAIDGERVWGPGRGWQAAAAKELDVTAQTVSNWTNNHSPIPAAVLILVGERLGKQTVLTDGGEPDSISPDVNT